jgi:hypothetical protein
MTGKEYCDALELLGLNFESAARFLRMDSRTSRRIGQGDDTLGWPRAALLRLMVARRIKTQEVEELMRDFNQENDE